MANIFQEEVAAEKPKSLSQEQVYIYVPRATVDSPGIASYDENYFELDGGKVYLKVTDPTVKPSLIKIRTDGQDGLIYDDGYLKTYLKSINGASLIGNSDLHLVTLDTAQTLTASGSNFKVINTTSDKYNVIKILATDTNDYLTMDANQILLKNNEFGNSINISSFGTITVEQTQNGQMIGASYIFPYGKSGTFALEADVNAVNTLANNLKNNVIKIYSPSNNSFAAGYGATANAQGAIQLGQGTNTTANTFQVYDYTVIDTSGKIPNARLTLDTVVTQGSNNALTSNAVYTALQEYTKTSDLGTAAFVNTGTTNGTVPLIGSDGKLPSSVIPASAITDTFVVNSQVEMLALAAEPGDVAIRTDLSKSFILKAEPASLLANWQELLSPAASVISVNGQTGVVVLSATDVGAQPTLTTEQAAAVNSGVTSATVAQVGNNLSEINLLKNTKQDNILEFSAVEVLANAWVSDNTYTEYPYKATIALTGVVQTMTPVVTFSNAAALSGNYSPVAETGNGSVTIWSKVANAIMIESILCVPMGDEDTSYAEYTNQAGGYTYSITSADYLIEANAAGGNTVTIGGND